MAKKALVQKQQKTPKFKVRVTPVAIGVDVHTRSTVSSACVASVFVRWHMPVNSPGVTKSSW